MATTSSKSRRTKSSHSKRHSKTPSSKAPSSGARHSKAKEQKPSSKTRSARSGKVAKAKAAKKKAAKGRPSGARRSKEQATSKKSATKKTKKKAKKVSAKATTKRKAASKKRTSKKKVKKVPARAKSAGTPSRRPITRTTTKRPVRKLSAGNAAPVSNTQLLNRRIQKLTSLLDVAKAMTAERDLDNLLKLILDEAVHVVNADRCTLWIVDADRNELWTKVAQGLGQDVIRIPIGVGIAGQVAATGEIINIPDAYADPRFNRQVDKDTGYRTRNILGVPMRDHHGEVTGVLQALNKEIEYETGFTSEDEDLLVALGSNAAVAIENAILYEEIDRLFEGFVKASVVAIESRDPTTSGHSERVAILTCGIAEQLDKLDEGMYGALRFTREDMREIRYAALLHDFGKVGVREHVLTKAKKLYPGELEVVETRFRALRAQREIAFLRSQIAALRDGQKIPQDHEAALDNELAQLDEFLEFIRKANQPTVLESGGFERLRDIASKTFDNEGTQAYLLNERELTRLSIPRGSLDQEERLEIESHVTHTFRFLAMIPWTRNLRHVPEIAYAHHEKLDGAGYPRQLQADQIPVQSRMMTIADIYDALTASDRPYKKAVPHERAIDILKSDMKQGRLDAALLDVFIDAKVHEAVVS